MRKLLRRLSALIHRRQLRRQMDEEMAAHLAMMPADRRRSFGSTLRFHEQAADHWGWTWLDHLRQDLVYGARAMRRSPGFALTAIAVLSLGIGVNLAEVHIFNAFLHHLHVRDPNSLFQFSRVDRRAMSRGLSLPEIDFYRRHNSAFSAVLTETRLDGVYHAQDADQLLCVLVNGSFFGELGVTPLYGRMVDDQDTRPGAPPVAVLAYDYWQNRFGGDPRAVMKTIRLNDRPVQVVGVGPPQFGGIDWHAQLWMAVSQYPYLTGGSANLGDFAVRSSAMFGRIKPGIALESARAQFQSLTAELRRQQPQYIDSGERLQIEPANDRQIPTSPASLLLFGTFILLVLLVLFSACANLGNMLLARGMARRREIEIRLAIGAGRWRLIRQLMTENLLLAALACVAALFTGRMASNILLRLIGAPADLRIVTDWRIVLTCAALGLAATFAFGLAPALQAVRRGSPATRYRKMLVAVQVTATCVLLILSSFFTRAIQHSFHTDVAFDYTGLAVVDPAFYAHNLTAAEARDAARQIAARLRSLPGIEAAALVTVPPFRRSRIEHAFGQQLYLNEVDPSYFAMMRQALLVGHIFGADEPDAVVISQSAARNLWPGRSPLGRTLHISQHACTVVGVVHDSGINQLMYPESVEVYLPIGDRDAPIATILVRAANNPASMASSIRSAAALPGIMPSVFTVEGLLNDRLGVLRKMLGIVDSLAGVASLLALVGIFGLLAFTVAQRTREIGVRMALGAGGKHVLRIVLGQFALPFAVGAALGVALAAGSVKVMRNLVFGYTSFDLASVVTGLLVFSVVALAASVAPARRALKIDPASALRYE